MRSRYAIVPILVLGILLSGSPLQSSQQGSADKEFLLEVQKNSANFFWEQANPKNGLIKDSSDEFSPCSVGAVGFGLVALCILEKNGWQSRRAVMQRLVRTLKTLRDKVEHEHGFFYHFVNMHNGKRVWLSEASSIDTALVVAGALFAGEYFKNTEVETLARQIYERVDWQWMMNGRNVMSMGYKPESGFLPYCWDSFNEGLLLYALAIGSPTHPISKNAWWAWSRPMSKSKAGEMVYCRTGSLFVYQYPNAFLDFRNLNDGHVNYWKNSVKATLANRFFCIQNKRKFKTYDENVWGITASLGPDGYKGYGAEPADEAVHDGTVAPSAAAGSLPFTPKISIAALRTMVDRYGDRVYGRYGFYDAFNVEKDWWAQTYIGIDQGITVVMIENLLDHTVWAYFMKHPSIKKWAALCMKPVHKKEKARKKRVVVARQPRKTLPAQLGMATCTANAGGTKELFSRLKVGPQMALAQVEELGTALYVPERNTLPAELAMVETEFRQDNSHLVVITLIKISIFGWWGLSLA